MHTFHTNDPWCSLQMLLVSIVDDYRFWEYFSRVKMRSNDKETRNKAPFPYWADYILCSCIRKINGFLFDWFCLHGSVSLLLIVQTPFRFDNLSFRFDWWCHVFLSRLCSMHWIVVAAKTHEKALIQNQPQLKQKRENRNIYFRIIYCRNITD